MNNSKDLLKVNKGKAFYKLQNELLAIKARPVFVHDSNDVICQDGKKRGQTLKFRQELFKELSVRTKEELGKLIKQNTNNRLSVYAKRERDGRKHDKSKT